MTATAMSAEELRSERWLFRPMEAADALGIGRTQLYKLIRVGQERRAKGLDPFPGLRSVKIGDSRRIPASALDEYVERLLQVEAA